MTKIPLRSSTDVEAINIMEGSMCEQAAVIIASEEPNTESQAAGCDSDRI